MKLQTITATAFQILLFITLITSLSFAKNVHADQAKVTKIYFSQDDNQLDTINILLNKPVNYQLFTLASPDRVIIDLAKTSNSFNIPSEKPTLITGIRHARHNNQDLRIVLDVAQPTQPYVKLKSKHLQIVLKHSSKQSAENYSQEERQEVSDTITALNADIVQLRSRIKELDELALLNDKLITAQKESLDHASTVIKEQTEVNKKIFSALEECRNSKSQ